MFPKERRRHFFIDPPLQFRYMFSISIVLLVVLAASLAHLYFGIWGGVIDSFSDERVLNDFLTASRLEEYEAARHPEAAPVEPLSPLSFFRQTERLSIRQREIFQELLLHTNRNLLGKLIFLFILIAWGTIYLSHKIAGPLFRFQKISEGLARGDLAIRCQLRKFDEAKRVAESLNQSLEFLDSTVSGIKKIASEGGADRERLLSRLREELAKFKTSGEP